MPTNIPSFLEMHVMFAQIFRKLFFRKIQIFKDYFFCRCRGAALTTGLAFAQRFVGYAVVKVLITYFTDAGYNLRDAFALINFLDGMSSFLVLPMTYISNNHVSPLKVILYSTAAYIIGMVMFCISNFYPIPDDKIWMYFVPAVLLISVGTAGGLPILEEFLVGQLMEHEPRLGKDEGRVNARKTVWWTASYSAFLPVLMFGNATWDVVLISSTSVMGIGYLLFLCCKPLYHRSVDEATTTETPSASPEEDISVDEATMTEISGARPEENISVDEATMTEISRARPEENISMDEATTTEISPASPGENINNGLAFFAISLVKQWKLLSVMIPMWSTVLVFGLVLSAGDTFFVDQGSNMESTVSIYVLLLISKIIKSTPSTCQLIRCFTAFPSKLSSTISNLLSKFIPKLNTQGIIVTIWTAMVLSIFCCSVAWRVEVHRLHVIAENELCTYPDDVIPMSIMWLAPQFCLLALMEGIGIQGLDLFFEVQVSDVPMEKYGSALNEAVISFGSLLNGLLVFHLRSWFQDRLNCSRLDKYYQMLTVVSFVNMCYFWWVSTFYSNKKGSKDDINAEETGVSAV